MVMETGRDQVNLAESVSTDGEVTVDTVIHPIGDWCLRDGGGDDSTVQVLPDDGDDDDGAEFPGIPVSTTRVTTRTRRSRFPFSA